MAKPLRLVACGAGGRMGARVAALAAADPRFLLEACVFHGRPGETFGAAAIGPDELDARLAQADALVDFSAPAASVRFARAAARARKAAVIGTTGLSASQLAAVKAASKRTPVFFSPNFSRGVNLLAHLAALAARTLPGYDAAVFEVHHKAKKDAPSGTALRLARAVAEARRDGKAVPAVSERVGAVVGEHTLTLAGPLERLELTHKAQSRDLFAQGALEAALWVRGRRPGLYDMPDLMGLRVKKALSRLKAAWDAFDSPDDPREPFYDPVHLGTLLVACLAAAGALFWLLWTLLVFEGGLFPKLEALAELAFMGKSARDLGYRGPWDRGVFEGALANAVALVLAGLLVAALHRLYFRARGRAPGR